MCIICECYCMNSASMHTAEMFLSEFERSRQAMKSAADIMLQVSKIAVTPEGRKQYDRTHKIMVKLIRQWNVLEQSREHRTVIDNPTE